MKNSANQKNLYKNTSLQAWNRLTDEYFHRKLRIEERKDREQIYLLIKKMGLPGERFCSFRDPIKLTYLEFEAAVKDLGFPYWISATPKISVNDLDRLSKLRISTVKQGWEFIRSIRRLNEYKIIVMQYANNPKFKGSVLVSKRLNGVAEFVLNDRHVQLIDGSVVTNPMLFNKYGIIRFSKTIDRRFQKELWSHVYRHPGHFEFQYGIIQNKKFLSFFDFNDELAYENIDKTYSDLIRFYRNAEKKKSGYIVKGLPASIGKAQGKCRIILGEDFNEYNSLQEGEVLVSDATNPNMTPIMKKASAIVTDLGGVTSHAAIVCREMKIPCIVGAKNATSMLKTGVVVDVDASSGLVSKLK